MKRLIQNKGSALVWAVCAMMVLSLVVASLMTMALSYYNHAVKEAAMQKAELLARSGARYAVQRLDINSEYFTDQWAPDFSEFSVTGELRDNEPKKVYFGGAAAGEEFATVYFTGTQQGEYVILKAISVAQCGDCTAKCAAAFYGNGEDGLWEFAGFVEA